MVFARQAATGLLKWCIVLHNFQTHVKHSSVSWAKSTKMCCAADSCFAFSGILSALNLAGNEESQEHRVLPPNWTSRQRMLWLGHVQSPSLCFKGGRALSELNVFHFIPFLFSVSISVSILYFLKLIPLFFSMLEQSPRWLPSTPWPRRLSLFVCFEFPITASYH